MNSWLRWSVGTTLSLAMLLATSAAVAAFHLFRIDQLYSNADGTVQFVVMHQEPTSSGENFWAGNSLTSTRAGVTKVFTFPANLPSSSTSGRRVLIATQGYAALGLVTPDYVMPNGFLPTNGGTVNYAGADQLTYAALPTDGVHAIDRNGATVTNLATNFAGASASVAAAPTLITPAIGLWWNPDESGTGYNFDVKHGVLVVTVFTYEATGHSAWYLASGALTLAGNSTTFSATLDKYGSGQCISCPYTGRPTSLGNDGTIAITFTSTTTATMSLPNGRVTAIQPQAF